MKHYLLFISLLLCAIPSRAAITDTGVGCAVATSGSGCTISGVQAGDFAYAFAYRSAVTAPSLPAGWTQIATASANSSSFRSACAVVAAGATTITVGTWTNATDLTIEVYRGVGIGSALLTTANCVTQGIGFKTTGGTSGTTSTITYTSGTLTDTGGTSWVVGASGSSATTCTPGTLTQKQTVGTGPQTKLNDTNAGVASFTTATCTGTTGNWKSDTLELRANQLCWGTDYLNGWTCVQSSQTANAGTGTAATATMVQNVVAGHGVLFTAMLCGSNLDCTVGSLPTTVTPTSGGSDSFVNAPTGCTNVNSNHEKICFWWVSSVNVGKTFIATCNATCFYLTVTASEWIGGDTSATPFDLDAYNASTAATTFTCTGGTTANANDLWAGTIFGASNLAFTPGTGFTEINENTAGAENEAKSVTSTGTLTVTWSSASQAAQWGCAGIKSASAPPPSTTLPLKNLLGVGL